MNEKLKEEIQTKAFRPMQRAGVYDPMEQAGHRDAIFVSNVLALLKDKVVVGEKELKKLLEDFKRVAEKPQDQLCLNLIYRLEQLITESGNQISQAEELPVKC